MTENIYCIYDKEAGISLKPFLIHRNDVAPVREFEEVATNKDSVLYKHAGDFDLMQIGQINLETMEIQQVEPRLVARGIDLIDKPTLVQ